MPKQNGLFNDIPVSKTKSKNITWKNVAELFLEKHNEKMRKPIERDSDKKVLFRYLQYWFNQKNIKQEQAYEIVPHFIHYFKSNDGDIKHDEWIKPMWFHPKYREQMDFKLSKGLEFALNKLNEPKQEQSLVNELEIPNDPELDDLFE